MSSGLATFFRPDGTTVGYGVFYGTADILRGIFAATAEEAWAAAPGEFPVCTCGQPPEPVVIFSEYGGEWWWQGEWCPRCRCILGPHDPDACQVCHENPYYREENPYYREAHQCVRAETHQGRPVFPVAAG